MIQLNLLPDVKTKYIATERTKRLTLLSATGVCVIAIGVVLSLVGVIYGAQKVKLNSLDKDINSYSSQLQGIEGLNKILTIQNQINSLTSLHSPKPATSRLFEFLPQITPTDVKIDNLTIGFGDNIITIDGSAVSLEAVNKFVDTIKFTEYFIIETVETEQTISTETAEIKQRAFSSVVLASFSKSSDSATYSITALFDPTIFSGDYQAISLSVPNITSTRSQTEQPDLLFQENPTQSEEDNPGLNTEVQL